MSLTMGSGPFGHRPAGRLAWDDLDAWFEEDERLISHAIDPYHRVDVRASSRHVVVALEGTTLADAPHAHALFETGLPTRWYLHREHVSRTCFFGEAVDLTIDGAAQERPETPWGRPGWWRAYDEAR